MRVEFQARAPGRRQFRNAQATAAVVALLGAALVSGHRLITPGFLLSAKQLNFAGDQPGVETAAQHVDLTNPFDADLRVESVTLRGDAGAFRFPWNSCVGKTIGPKNTCQIGVSFVPPSPGTQIAALEVASVNGDRRTVELTGLLKLPAPAKVETPNPELQNNTTPPDQDQVPPAPSPPIHAATAVRPPGVKTGVTVSPPKTPIPPPAPAVPAVPTVIAASLTPDPVQFPSVTVGSGIERDITITNTGNAPFPAGQAAIQGDHWNDFRIVDDPCSLRTIVSPCAIRVAFLPVEAGQHRAELVLPGGGTQTSVLLDGTASPPPMPIADIQPAELDLTRMEPEHSIELRNMGDGKLTVSGTFLGGKNPEDFSLDPRTCAAASLGRNQGCTLSVVFRADIAKREKHKMSETLVTVRDNAQGSPHTVVVTAMEGSNGHKKVLLRILEGGAAAGTAYGIYRATHGDPAPAPAPAPKGNPTTAVPLPSQKPPQQPTQTDTSHPPGCAT